MKMTNAELLTGLPSTSIATIHLEWTHALTDDFTGSFFALDFPMCLGILSEKLPVIFSHSLSLPIYLFSISLSLSSPFIDHRSTPVWNFCGHFSMPPSHHTCHHWSSSKNDISGPLIYDGTVAIPYPTCRPTGHSIPSLDIWYCFCPAASLLLVLGSGS